MANDFKRFTSGTIRYNERLGASNSSIYCARSSSTTMESIVIGITLANKSNGITTLYFWTILMVQMMFILLKTA